MIMLYEATWGLGYAQQHTSIRGEAFFTKENGYSQDDISNVLALEIGETADLSSLSGYHSVKRIA